MTHIYQPPCDALPPSAQMLALQLMQAILTRHSTSEGDRFAEVWGVDDIPELARQPDITASLALAGLGVPEASEMTEAEIDSALGRGHDPWATSLDGILKQRVLHPPVIDLLTAVKFASAFPDEAAIDDLFTPGLTLIRISAALDRKQINTALPFILETLVKVPGHDFRDPKRLTLVFLDETAPEILKRKRATLHEKCDSEIALGKSVIVLARDPDDLSHSSRAMLRRDLDWPATDQNVAIEMMRGTHSMTGQLAEAALRAALPSDRILTDMPWPLVSSAFHAGTSFEVAERLSNMPSPTSDTPRLTLTSIMGIQTVRAEFDRLVDDTNAWRAGLLDWADVSSSLLLIGPPGTGKTMLAEAFAGSARARFISTSYADAQKAGHMGDYLRVMADHAETAISSPPSVFFIDEIDSYRKRNGAGSHNDRYMSSVVNGLLETLSRLNNAAGVTLIAATNHADQIDPALIRSGRFDLKLLVGLPDRTGCEAILRGQLAEPDLDLNDLPHRLIGMSGAEIAAVARDAKGGARRAKTGLTIAHISDALNRIVPDADDEKILRVAYHEAGHAVVAHVLEMPPAKRIFIAPRGGGIEAPRRNVLTRITASRQLTTLLAGRAAEQMIYGAPSTGAGGDEASDLAIATEMALDMETRWGLGDGPPLHTPIDIDDRYRMPKRLRLSVAQHIQKAETCAFQILDANRTCLERVATALFDQRELSGKALIQILNGEDRTSGAVNKNK